MHWSTGQVWQRDLWRAASRFCRVQRRRQDSDYFSSRENSNPEGSGYHGGGGTSGGGGSSDSYDAGPDRGGASGSSTPPSAPGASPSSPVPAPAPSGPGAPGGPGTFKLELPDIPLRGISRFQPILPFIPFPISRPIQDRRVISPTATLDYILYWMFSAGVNLFANVGPGAIRNIELYVTPTSLEAGATAELHIPAYFGLQLPIVLGGAGEGLVCDLGPPPVSFYIAASLGGIGTGTAALLADFTSRISFGVGINPSLILVSPLLAVTPQFFSRRTTLDIGGVLDFMVNLFGSAHVAGREFCLISPTVKRWSAGKAVKLTSDLDIDLTGRSGSIASGGDHVTPMPIADLMSAVAYSTPPPLCPQATPFLLTHLGSGPSLAPHLPVSPPGTPPIAPPFAPPSVPGLPGAPAAKPTFTCPVPPPKGGKKCATGLSASDAIPFIWMKPFDAYEQEIDLFDEEAGKFKAYKPRTPKKVHIFRDNKPDCEMTIGVPNWPHSATPFEFPQVRGRPGGDANKEEFVDCLKEGGYEGFSSKQADHVFDLWFGGQDEFDNLWPIDATVNSKSGRGNIAQAVQLSATTDPPGSACATCALGASGMKGKWIKIYRTDTVWPEPLKGDPRCE